jgi:hypothetical protein
MNEESIVIYDSKEQLFKLFDVKTKSLTSTLHEQKAPGSVNGIAL